MKLARLLFAKIERAQISCLYHRLLICESNIQYKIWIKYFLCDRKIRSNIRCFAWCCYSYSYFLPLARRASFRIQSLLLSQNSTKRETMENLACYIIGKIMLNQIPYLFNSGTYRVFKSIKEKLDPVYGINARIHTIWSCSRKRYPVALIHHQKK